MKLVFAFLIVLLTTFDTKADSSWWELRKVQITMNDGEIIIGFLKWNEEWLDNQEMKVWKNNFPESFIHYYRNLYSKMGSSYNKKILVFKELYIVRNDSINKLIDLNTKLIASKKELLIELDFHQIKSVIEIKYQKEIYGGVSDINIFTQEELDKLKTNPYATYHLEAPVSTVYFLIYKPEVSIEQLKELKVPNYLEQIQTIKEKGVIIFSISFD